jgi:hypothetical protein
MRPPAFNLRDTIAKDRDFDAWALIALSGETKPRIYSSRQLAARILVARGIACGDRVAILFVNRRGFVGRVRRHVRLRRRLLRARAPSETHQAAVVLVSDAIKGRRWCFNIRAVSGFCRNCRSLALTRSTANRSQHWLAS